MKKKSETLKKVLKKSVDTIATIGFWSAIMPAIGISIIRYHMRIEKKK
tara:strand:+ start:16523 stop:16666 length:144 start_codon:yes stop_codon:yes gene_type:complete